MPTYSVRYPLCRRGWCPAVSPVPLCPPTVTLDGCGDLDPDPRSRPDEPGGRQRWLVPSAPRKPYLSKERNDISCNAFADTLLISVSLSRPMKDWEAQNITFVKCTWYMCLMRNSELNAGNVECRVGIGSEIAYECNRRIINASVALMQTTLLNPTQLDIFTFLALSWSWTHRHDLIAFVLDSAWPLPLLRLSSLAARLLTLSCSMTNSSSL